MSPLAFDKQGKPFAFQRRTKKLRVRLFRNPSARGTCCQVLDIDGQPLYVDPETDYAEFRKAVGQVPGLYRLDQCDEDGNELDDAQAAYVSIDVARNAQTGDGGSGDVNPLVIIQQMAAIQADVMKTMAAQQAALMAATAEILRAPYRPVPIAAPATELRNADASAEDDDRDDEDENDEPEETAPEHPAMAALRMVEPHLPQLGAFFYDKIADFLRHIYSSKSSATAAAATPAPMPAFVAPPMAPQPTGEPVSIAAAPTPASASPSGTAPNTVQAATVTVPATSSDSTAHGPAATQAPMASPTVTPATPTVPPIPTREQLAHLFAIREQLEPDERAIAENAISRMDALMQAQWLAALSEMPIEEATTVIRGMVADIQQRRGSKQR